MMDSQENTLGQEKTEELNMAPADNSVKTDTDTTDTTVSEPAEAPVDTAAGDIDAAAGEAPEPKKVYKTKKEVIERLKEIAHSDDDPQKDEVEYLKTIFYKLHFAEREADMKAYVEAGGDPENYKVTPDEYENEFKAEMSVIKEKRAKIFLEQERLKQENLKKKLDIIEKIKAMATSPEEANKSYQDFKKLQQEWKEIKLVPAEKANELWRNYQLYVEQYYDLLKLNNEAREYDFKKNLEIKTHLCEAAEKLADESDVISAFHQLQKLHQEYRETGPVAKELREDMWARFKAASTVINKRHQQHFEELRSKEEENLEKKTALCEKVEEIAKEEVKNAGDWDKKTKEIIAIQAEWKTIGFAPQKMNVKIFERFRSACDDFFGKKAEFFKDLKQKFAENAEKKKALVEQAQALQDSTDWKATSDKLVALQKEWKTIGMVPKKLGDKLWNDFLTACNHFFDARNNANAGTRTEERANLEKKRDIIAQLKKLADDAEDDIQEKVRELVEQYNAVGHVPFKEKDNVYKEYHDILGRLYKELNITTARRRLDKFKSNLKNVAEKGVDALDNERARLMRRYEQLKQEIQTYENNMGFLNASSKKGNSLIDEMNRKVQKLKDDMNLVREKIKAIDAEN
jgi:DNA repair exonuclease SbcCD ATPase subunit